MLRIITLNTWKGAGAYRQRLKVMIDQLSLLKPDILCLQEVLQSEDKSFDTSATIAKELDLQSVFAPARCKKRNVEEWRFNCYSGLAVLSRHEIVFQQIDCLNSLPDDPERIALSVVVDFDNRDLLVTNLHLTHLAHQDTIRFKQLLQAIKTIQTHHSSAPWLCCGDFNTTLSKQQLEIVHKQTDIKVIDLYLEGKGDLPGYTFGSTSLETKPRRIDYALNMTSKKRQRLNSTKARVVLQNPDERGIFPSDHFGVMVDIQLPQS